MRWIQIRVDSCSDVIARATKGFVQSKLGKLFLSIVLLGPLTFIPTIWAAWTAPNIDSLRTLTWPLMIVINVSAGLNVVHNGDWRMRLVSAVWTLMMAAVFIAILVR